MYGISFFGIWHNQFTKKIYMIMIEDKQIEKYITRRDYYEQGKREYYKRNI